MSTSRSDDTQTPDEREWEAQETARLQQRNTPQRSGPPAPSAYETIAALLAEPDVPPPPSNLAYVLATRVAAVAQARKREDRNFLRGLRLAFVLGYGGCMVLASVVYRDALMAWAGLLAASPLSAAANWIPVLAICVGITAVLSRKRRAKG